MIKAVDISYSYGSGTIFKNASFSVGKNMKVGLVGPNGAGKSTLFSLLLSPELTTTGKLEIVGTLGHVPQEIKHDSIMEKASSTREYVDPQHKKENHEIEKMMHGLELVVHLSEKPQQLSGGQKTKLALLRALIAEPDILFLDEPTNFLDTDGKAWLMHFLSTYPYTLIMISHDLSLLDAHIEKVLAVNQLTKRIDEYKGNYTKYISLKKEQESLLTRKIINEQKHIKQMEKGLEKMARFTSEKGVRQRTNLKHRIQRLKDSLPDLPSEIKQIKISLPPPSPTGEIPIWAKNISKTFGEDIVLTDVTVALRKNERLALLGPNGAGKSTFIKILMGMITPDSGTVEKDMNLNIGYYSQEFETFAMSKTVMETVQEKCEYPESRIRPFLAKFNFPGQKIFQPIETLSGGEKTRLSIALLMVQNYNLLLLDEPTTYLDVMSQRVILDALKSYSGAMIFVSHTEEFVSELKPNRVLFLPENKLTYWIPEYTENVSII